MKRPVQISRIKKKRERGERTKRKETSETEKKKGRLQLRQVHLGAEHQQGSSPKGGEQKPTRGSSQASWSRKGKVKIDVRTVSNSRALGKTRGKTEKGKEIHQT